MKSNEIQPAISECYSLSNNARPCDETEQKSSANTSAPEKACIRFENTKIRLGLFKGKPGHLSLILKSLKKNPKLDPLNDLTV